MFTAHFFIFVLLSAFVNGFGNYRRTRRSFQSAQWMISSSVTDEDTGMVSLGDITSKIESVALPDLPSLEEIKTDPFMKQVRYGGILATYLSELNDHSVEDEVNSEQIQRVSKLLTAQLQHRTGIRGFFVSYLTADTQDLDESESTTTFTVPRILIDAIQKADEKEIVSLICMNVVMPTAVASMHDDLKLAKASQRTAQRAVHVLMCMIDNIEMRKNCRAIYLASTRDGSNVDKEDILVEYWTTFMENYGYGKEQKRDIAAVFHDVINLYLRRKSDDQIVPIEDDSQQGSNEDSN